MNENPIEDEKVGKKSGVKLDLELLIADGIAKANAYSVELVKAHDKALATRMDYQDEQVERAQNQVGALTQGFMQMTAVVQAIVTFILNMPEEKGKEFQDHLKQAQRDYIDNLKYATTKAQAATDHFTPHAPDNVEQHPGDQVTE